MTTRMRIAFFSPFDPWDSMAMSGLPYAARRALSDVCDVHVFHPIVKQGTLGRVARRLGRMMGQVYHDQNSVAYSIHCGSRIREILCRGNFDFAFFAFGNTLAAHLNSPCPVICWSDTTWSLLKDYYQFARDLCVLSRKDLDIIEGRALRNASVLLYSSEWAALSAIRDYGCPPEKVFVAPFGPNVSCGLETQALRNANYDEGPCRLLFLGRDWERKGGQIALDAFHALRDLGVSSEIVFCGCEGTPGLCGDGITFIRGLDKRIDAQARQLEDLIRSSHFLILPTRADCTPLVIAEASAYGLPVIATDTGGVGGMLHEGVNGHMLPLSADGPEYARLIASIYSDRGRYRSLRQSSRALYESRLNWNAWRDTLCDIMQSVKYERTANAI